VLLKFISYVAIKAIVTVGKQNYHVITIETGRNIVISKYSINAVLIRKAR